MITVVVILAIVLERQWGMMEERAALESDFLGLNPASTMY